MKTLLLCGYRNPNNEPPLGLTPEVKWKDQNLTTLERQIQSLKKISQDVVCVLSGTQAEVQIRQTRALDSCEIVYDTNEHASLMTNVQAGLALTQEAVFVLPVEVPAPSPEVWNELMVRYAQLGWCTPRLGLQLELDDLRAPYGFPLLVTRTGNQTLKKSGKIDDLRQLLLRVTETKHRETLAWDSTKP